MYKKSINKQEQRRVRETRKGDRGDHTSRRACHLPRNDLNNEFEAENLQGYLYGKNAGVYSMRVQEDIGDTGGDTIKQLIAKRQEELAMKKIALARIMLQSNPEYGVRLSDKHLRKIEEKMLRETKPLDINKRRMLYQMYTFKKSNEDNRNNSIKMEGLTQPDSTEMGTESEAEEPFEIYCERATEGIQTDISVYNSTKANERTALPTLKKEPLQGNPVDIPKTPAQDVAIDVLKEPLKKTQQDIAKATSQKTPVEITKENFQKKQTEASGPLNQKLPLNARNHPSQAGNQPSQNKSIDVIKEPPHPIQPEIAHTSSQKMPVEVTKDILQRKPAPTQKVPVNARNHPPQVGNQPSNTMSINVIKEPRNPRVANVPSQRLPSELAKENSQRKQATVSNSTYKPPNENATEPLQVQNTHAGNQSVIHAYITNTTTQLPPQQPQKVLPNMTNQRTRNKQLDRLKNPALQRTYVHAEGESLKEQRDLPQSPSRKRYARAQQVQTSPYPYNQRKLREKSLSPEQRLVDTPQNSPTMRKRNVKKRTTSDGLRKYNVIVASPKSSPTNHKRKPLIKTLTITQKGHSTKIYKAVSFVEQKKAALKINMNQKQVPSRGPSSSRSHKSKQLSTSQESTSSNHNSPRRDEKDDSPHEKESPSCIAKLVMNRRFKNKNKRKRSWSPEMEEPPLPQTEVAKWAPQSVNEHTKPYYEAWVNTTLTAVSSDNEHVRKEKEKIMEMMRERLECLQLSEEELSDERYTGRIKVNTHR